jgi:hypothetical protein
MFSLFKTLLKNQFNDFNGLIFLFSKKMKNGYQGQVVRMRARVIQRNAEQHKIQYFLNNPIAPGD